MLFDIKQETLPREEMEALQLRRLRDLCTRVLRQRAFLPQPIWCREHSPAYIMSRTSVATRSDQEHLEGMV